MYSGDLQNWSAAKSVPTTNRLNGVAPMGSGFIAVGESGTILVSADGKTWLAQASGVTGYLHGICSGANVTYVCGLGGVLLEQYAAGTPGAFSVPWNAVQTNSAANLEAIVNLGGVSFPVQAGANVTPTFDDFVTTGQAVAIEFSNNLTVTPGSTEYETSSVSSIDPTGAAGDFRALAYGNGYLVAGAETGPLLISLDKGNTWTPISSIAGPAAASSSGYLGAAYSPTLNTFVVVGYSGSIVTSSAAANAVSPSARLVNISTRAQVGTGGNILIPGFVIGGSGTETLLIRADGPSLTAFGVTGALAQPSLSLFSSTGSVIASNTGWGTNVNPDFIASTASDVGAFPFTAGSADCALIASLPGGAYTVQISGVNNTTGVALAEVYEVSSSGTSLTNISTRAQVGTGGNILIPGFVISGAGTEQLLVRGDGPSLAQFGVLGVLAEPSLSVFNSSSTAIASNTGWETSADPSLIANSAASVGAFQFVSGSADSAQIVNLAAGAYTIQISGVNNTTGVALAEIYETSSSTPTPTPTPTPTSTSTSNIILSASSANVGASLAITGASFNPSATTTTVTFTDVAGNVLSIPADNVTAGEVDVTVPCYFNLTNGTNTQAAVSVAVTQVANLTTTFGPVSNFTINALPATGLTPGSLTLAFMQQEQTLLVAAQQSWAQIGTASGGAVNTGPLLTTYSSMQAQLANVIPLIQQLEGGTISQIPLGTLNGQTVKLTVGSLTLMDQIISAYLSQGQTTVTAQSLASTIARVLSPNVVNLGFLGGTTRLTATDVATALTPSPATLTNILTSTSELRALSLCVLGVVVALQPELIPIEPELAAGAIWLASTGPAIAAVYAFQAGAYLGVLSLQNNQSYQVAVAAWNQTFDDLQDSFTDGAAAFIPGAGTPGGASVQGAFDAITSLNDYADLNDASSVSSTTVAHLNNIQANLTPISPGSPGLSVGGKSGQNK